MVKVLDHPLLVHKVNTIRSLNTSRGELFALLEDIGALMTYEALKDADLEEREIEIWIGRRTFGFLREESIALVPIMRAGLPMFNGAKRILPNALSGFLALSRNEETLSAEVFYSKIPKGGDRVFIYDPMLATGGTLLRALSLLREQGFNKTISFHIVAVEESLRKVEKSFPDHSLYTVSIDEGLNSQGFIIPGLGDMGDRLFS